MPAMHHAMRYDPEKHHRRSIRLPDYDYRRPGAYFVTVCAHAGQCLFGVVTAEQVKLSDYGRIVTEEWHRTEALRDNVRLDAFVVMPNHVHGIIALVPPGTQGDADPHGYRAFAHSPAAVDHAAMDGRTVGAQRRGAPTHAHATHATTDRNGRPNVAPGSLGAVVRGFKAAATRRINRRRGTPGGAVWQRNYYEHIIRHERAWHACRRYIDANPRRWPLDACHPAPTNANVPAGGPRP